MRVWFITGASRGFGALIAAEALAQGDAVVATARDPNAVTARLGSHERLLATRLDVTNEAEAHEAAGLAVKTIRPHRCAGQQCRLWPARRGRGSQREGSRAPLRHQRVRPAGRHPRGAAAYAPPAIRPHHEHVVGRRLCGFPGWGVYGSTKFAVEGITEALAAEVAPLGIHVTVVEPGFFRTDFLDDNSLVRTALEIDDYHATVGKTRSHAADVNHAQPGDPSKLAKAFMQLAACRRTRRSACRSAATRLRGSKPSMRLSKRNWPRGATWPRRRTSRNRASLTARSSSTRDCDEAIQSSETGIGLLRRVASLPERGDAILPCA